MAIDEVKALERRLRNYSYFKNEKIRLEEEIKHCYDSLGASPHSPAFGSEPIHSPKNLDREYETREKIEDLLKEKALVESELRYLDSVLANVADDLTKPIYETYVLNKPMNTVRKRYGYSYGGLYKVLHRELERIIESGKNISK